jgi:hypothetical protein
MHLPRLPHHHWLSEKPLQRKPGNGFDEVVKTASSYYCPGKNLSKAISDLAFFMVD